MEYLSRGLNRMDVMNEFQFHPKCKKIKLTHLLFADDLLIFCGGDKDSVDCVMERLHHFFGCSGMEANFSKSQFFTVGVPLPEQRQFKDSCGFDRGSLPIKYLGIPLSNRSLTAPECSQLIKKMTSRIDSWTTKFLTRAGKVVLIRSILQSIAMYWARIFLIPHKVLKAVNAICSNFLWRAAGKTRGNHRVAWDTCCLPLVEGGLGLKDLKVFNQSLILSQVNELLRRDNNVWIQWIEQYWLKGRNFWEAEPKSDDSWVVKKLWKVRDQSLSCWDVANGPISWIGVGQGFSVANAYQSLRSREAPVPWFRVIWNGFATPNHAFTSWLVMRDKLLTRGNMKDWNMITDISCPFCGYPEETRDHLFFDCASTKQFWEATMEMLRLRSAPAQWTQIVAWIPSLRASNLRKRIISAALTMVAFWTWRCRNLKVFEGISWNPGVIISKVKWMFKIKLFRLLGRIKSSRDRHWIENVVCR